MVTTTEAILTAKLWGKKKQRDTKQKMKSMSKQASPLECFALYGKNLLIWHVENEPNTWNDWTG